MDGMACWLAFCRPTPAGTTFMRRIAPPMLPRSSNGALLCPACLPACLTLCLQLQRVIARDFILCEEGGSRAEGWLASCAARLVYTSLRAWASGLACPPSLPLTSTAVPLHVHACPPACSQEPSTLLDLGAGWPRQQLAGEAGGGCKQAKQLPFLPPIWLVGRVVGSRQASKAATCHGPCLAAGILALLTCCLPLLRGWPRCLQLLEFILALPFAVGYKTGPVARLLAATLAAEAVTCWPFWAAWPTKSYSAHVRCVDILLLNPGQRLADS